MTVGIYGKLAKVIVLRANTQKHIFNEALVFINKLCYIILYYLEEDT